MSSAKRWSIIAAAMFGGILFVHFFSDTKVDDGVGAIILIGTFFASLLIFRLSGNPGIREASKVAGVLFGIFAIGWGLMAFDDQSLHRFVVSGVTVGISVAYFVPHLFHKNLSEAP